MITDARTDQDQDAAGGRDRPRSTRPPVALFDAVAGTLTPLRLSLSRQDEVESAQSIGITELLGIPDVTRVSPELAWVPRSPRDFLRVPIGLDDFGVPVLLDLKESAQLGMGPHGICIGATGSGKSEMLRTLITALALSHPPEDLSMVLVDYKGGAAFAPFQGLPHVAGIIDNLADDPQLTERARASINGEVVRRQELLRDADSSPSISHYRELRERRRAEGGPELPPLPHLFVVIDEFGELITAEPEFVDLLISDRPDRPVDRRPPAAVQPADRVREATRSRHLPVLPDRAAHLLGVGELGGAGHPGRVSSAGHPGLRLSQGRHLDLPAVPLRLRLRSGRRGRRRRRPRTGAGRPQPLLLPTYNGLQPDGAGEDAEEELRRPDGRPPAGRRVRRPAAARATREVTPVWLPPLPSRLALARGSCPRAGRTADRQSRWRCPSV